jgi:hypothetical protein
MILLVLSSIAQYWEAVMGILTSKIIASLLQMHGPDATIQSDHQGIDALLSDMRGQISRSGADLSPGKTIDATQVYFRRGGFVRGYGGGAFRRGAAGAGGFRRAAGFRRV